MRMLTAQTQETVVAEVQSLDRAYRRGGLPLLVRFVETRWVPEVAAFQEYDFVDVTD